MGQHLLGSIGGQLVAAAAVVSTLGSCAAVPVLRRRMPAAPRRFRLPLGPTIPVLALVTVIALVATRLVASQQPPAPLLAGFGAMLAIGIVPAALWRLARSRRP